MKNIISTKNAPQAIGPYSQAVLVNKTLYLSGQIALTPDKGELVSDDVKQQTEQILKNIEAVLNSAGSSPKDVVKTTVFLTNINDFAVVNECYAKTFNQNPPARSCVAVANLPKGAKVEIEVIAQLD